MAVYGDRNSYIRMRQGRASLTEELACPEVMNSELLEGLGSVEGVRGVAKARQISCSPCFDIEGFLSSFKEVIEVVEDYNLSSDISGYIEYSHSDGRWIIGVNNFQGKPRQRFTLAHELAHLVLHGAYIKQKGRHEDKKLLRSDDEDMFDAVEKEADSFAGRLLMPISVIEEQIKSGNNTIAGLAECFNVSIAAMKYRLNECGLDWIK